MIPGEKLDGVHSLWDVKGKRFLSRQGNVFHAPDWFVEGLPDVALDGELWLARKSFQRTVSIVRRQDKSELWKEVSFVVFDAPGIDDAFEKRLQFYKGFLAKTPLPHTRLHAQQECRSLDHLRKELAAVEALGGEGLMLRRPESRYEVGCSLTLLKVKTFHDAEATVLAHLPGKGRHKGRLGALEVHHRSADRSGPPATCSLPQDHPELTPPCSLRTLTDTS